MKWESIQTSWQNANGSTDDSEVKRLAQIAKERDQNLHRSVRRRDFLETGIALLMVPWFGFFTWSAWNKGLWITAVAGVWLVGCCLFIPWRLRKSRKLLPDPDLSTSMIVYLKAKREAAQAQYRLLKGILAWYLGPISMGVILFYFGIQGWSLSTLYYVLFVLGLGFAVYLLNQRAAARKMGPLIERLDEQIRELHREDVS